MALVVNSERIDGTKLHRLKIYNNGVFIGEYERSQEADIERKKDEIASAATILIDIFEQRGKFVVRWDSKRRLKAIRVNKEQVGEIPARHWGKPSWAGK